jgi:hypothetical protein
LFLVGVALQPGCREAEVFQSAARLRVSEPAERLTVAEVTGGPVFTLTNDASIVTRLESGESVLGVVQLSNGFFLLLIQRSVQDVEMRLIDPAGAQRRVFPLTRRGTPLAVT